MQGFEDQQTLSVFFEQLNTQGHTIFPIDLVLNKSDRKQLVLFSEKNITNKKHQVCVLGHERRLLIGKNGITIARKITKKISTRSPRIFPTQELLPGKCPTIPPLI